MILPVIICSHNRNKLLKQTIESLRKNSDSELQIIISDSSSDEETVKYLESLDDITYYHFKCTDKQYGPSIGQAKMKGSDLAKPSEYIYFSDDDMYFFPHWDTIMIKALEKYDDLVIVGGRNLRIFDLEESRPIDETYTVTNMSRQTGYSMMFRRNEWEKQPYFPNYDEDSWVGFEFRALLTKNIGTINPPVLIHCGLTRVSKQNNEPENSKTYDWQDIEQDMKNYPEILFE